jgi:hypothetical protein
MEVTFKGKTMGEIVPQMLGFLSTVKGLNLTMAEPTKEGKENAEAGAVQDVPGAQR